MTIKRSITFKIIISYILIIISALIIVGVLFGFLAKFYSEMQSRKQLINDANAIYDIILSEDKNSDLSDAQAKLDIQKKVFSQVGRMDSDFALVSKDSKVLYPKNEEAEKFKRQLLPQISKQLNAKADKFMRIQVDGIEYLLVILPPRNNVSPGLRGNMVLYNPVGPVQRLSKALIIVLFISLALTAFIAIAAGIFMAKNIARPIIMLKNRADKLSKLDFEGNVEIHTGDELEELGDTINRMAIELKEYDVSQKNFFQNASHELKTPLMSIQGYAEGIKDNVFDSNDEALDIIIEETKRMKSLVDELIYLSKIESNSELYTFKPESMNEVLKNSIEKLKGIAVKDNIDISLTLNTDIELNIDCNKIIQALINLMGNCLRYAKSEINVTASVCEKWYEIIICDNGTGLTEEDLRNIFKRFYKGKNGGTGLGLAITKSIIERHNGTVEAGNCTNGGAMFKIKLPLSK